MDEALSQNSIHDVKEDIREAAGSDCNAGEELGRIELRIVRSRRSEGV